jgi:opacity protein-like surface antigen
MTSFRVRFLSAVCFALLTLLAVAPAAWAAGKEKEAEFWVGYYDPKPSSLDSDTSFGGRTLMAVSPTVAFGMEVGYVSTRGDATSGGTTGSVKWSSIFIDFISDFRLTHGKKVVPVFTLGLGTSIGNADTSLSGPISGVSISDLDTTSLSAQVGFGVKIDVSQKMFLRPAVRGRWFRARSEDDWDTEYLVGLGWRF